MPARAISSVMRGLTTAEFVLVSVTCWPTIGARSVSNASANCSMSRRTPLPWSPLREADGAETERVRLVEYDGRLKKRKIVSVLPSCRKPKPRTWSPWCGWFNALLNGSSGHPEHADLLIHVAQMRDLDDLRLVLEARIAVGSEEALRRSRGVAALAGEAEVRRGLTPSERRPLTLPPPTPVVLGLGPPDVKLLPSQKLRPLACAGVSELSSARTGFGGSCTCSWKSLNACMSVLASSAERPTRPGNATMKLRNERSSSWSPTARRSRSSDRRASASGRGSTCRAASASSSAPSGR